MAPPAAPLPPPFWVIATVLILGAILGLASDIAPWSFTWIALALYALGVIGEVVVFSAVSTGGLIAPEFQTLFTWSLRLVNLMWVMLAIGTAVLLARRSRREALFSFTLFAGAGIVGFPILTGPSAAANGTALALTEGIVALWLIREFLRGGESRWRPVWGMIGLVLLNAPAKGWTVLTAGAPLVDAAVTLGSRVGSAWLEDVTVLAAAFVATRVYLALRVRSA